MKTMILGLLMCLCLSMGCESKPATIEPVKKCKCYCCDCLDCKCESGDCKCISRPLTEGK